MKISYRRTGGFAGMVMSYAFTTEELPPEEAAAIRDLVRKANFFELPTQFESPGLGADQFEHQLKVETKEQQHTINFGDAAVPENLEILLEKIRIFSRKNRNP